jgi:octaprenyl-diphosphate synthase
MKELRTASPATLKSLYAAIREDLGRVEEIIRRELSSRYDYLEQMTSHVMKFAGKRIRPALLLYSARLCGNVKPVHLQLAAIVEILHNATLVHDDVLDESMMRRNLSTMNQRYGNEEAIIYGDYLFSRAFSMSVGLKDPLAQQIIAETTQKMCLGEMLQLSRRHCVSMSEEEYKEIIHLKTASLFETAMRLGAIQNNCEPALIEALSRYGLNLGMAFQMIDDCLDVAGEENEVGKSLGTDVNRGKMTLPCLELLKRLPSSEQAELKRLLAFENGISNKKARLKAMMEDHNVMPEAIRAASSYAVEAREIARTLAVEPLARIADFVIDRKK